MAKSGGWRHGPGMVPPSWSGTGRQSPRPLPRSSNRAWTRSAPAGKDGDHAGPRRPEVAVRVLDPAVRSWGGGLAERVEVGVESAVVHERPGVGEPQSERLAGWEQVVRPLVAGAVERVV